MNHIHFYEGCMIIIVEKRPTSFDNEVIAQSGGNACPVFLLKTYHRKLDIDPTPMNLFSNHWLKLSPPPS